MNILLATYSYFPYDFGGTEVYVSGLAKYLTSLGHHVEIVAATSQQAFKDYPIKFEDAHLKMVQYTWEGVVVNAVMLKDNSADAIYKKHKHEWISSWANAITRFIRSNWEVLHIHCNTAAVGLSLVEAVKIKHPKVKILGSYHLPLACSKSSLLFANTSNACIVKAERNICTSCIISTRTALSINLARLFSQILPPLSSSMFSPSLQIKYLVGKSIENFHAFDRQIAKWISFSEQMRTHLIVNGVKADKIELFRHGINQNIFFNPPIEKRSPEVFLYVGRLAKDKGFFTLLKAWMKLEPSQARELLIIGREHLNDQRVKEWKAVSDSRKDIAWLGEKAVSEVASLMQKAVCVIIPSECVETGPLVFHEAIACGADVIASNIGGCKELASLYSEKSETFEVGNVDQLAGVICNFKYSGKTARVETSNEHYAEVSAIYNR